MALHRQGNQRSVRSPRHGDRQGNRSEEHTSELQSHLNLVCRLLLEKKKKHCDHKPSFKGWSRLLEEKHDTVITRKHLAPRIDNAQLLSSGHRGYMYTAELFISSYTH